MPTQTFFNLPDKKRRRIVKAAKKAFSEAHYKKVTIDSIVNLADIPKGSFYQYFENKDDLFMYLFHQLGEEKAKILDKAAKKVNSETFPQFILKLTLKASEFENQDQEIAELKNRFLKECPQEIKQKILKSYIPATNKLFEKIIKRYIDKGHFRKNLNIKNAAFVITCCVMNLENYEIDNKSYEYVLVDLMDIISKGFLR